MRGPAADRLLGLRVRIPPGAWMFVLCLLYSKDKRQKPGQSGQSSKDKVQTENNKKTSLKAWMFVSCMSHFVQVATAATSWPFVQESYRT
jgi:hypothetical protein